MTKENPSGDEPAMSKFVVPLDARPHPSHRGSRLAREVVASVERHFAMARISYPPAMVGCAAQ
jgi:hypothetical protein